MSVDNISQGAIESDCIMKSPTFLLLSRSLHNQPAVLVVSFGHVHRNLRHLAASRQSAGRAAPAAQRGRCWAVRKQRSHDAISLIYHQMDVLWTDCCVNVHLVRGRRGYKWTAVKGHLHSGCGKLHSCTVANLPAGLSS